MKLEIGSYQLPCFGHSVSGDVVYHFETEHYASFGVFDVTGHGAEAAVVARLIKDWLPHLDTQRPDRLLKQVHDKLRGQGSAVGTAISIERDNARMLLSGVGNCDFWRYSNGRVKVYHAKSGLLGEVFPTPFIHEEDITPGDVIVVASDGLRSPAEQATSLYAYLSPEELAVRLIREFGRQHDDASCVVVRYPRLEEAA